ncbi:MAG TPA: CxxC-x17-CxxC domain-containing protein [Candidatus Nanoarchaeia archaeon]|nr:CxxC-x17-CxxC domain-containing protein [Candidatus Nanoarchaeia archaeon]
MGHFKREGEFGRRDSSRSGYGGQRRFGRGSDRPGRSSFGRSEFEKEMHSAICDKCGEKCEVPFRPSGDKPVYCSNCFRKNEKFQSRGPTQNNSEFDEINKKLDTILEILRKR